MPVIEVKLIDEVFSPAQKKETITRITDAIAAIGGENMRPVTFVIVQEVPSGNWGVGGKVMTADAVKALPASAK